MANAPKYGGNLPVGPGSRGGKTQDKPPGLGPLKWLPALVKLVTAWKTVSTRKPQLSDHRRDEPPEVSKRPSTPEVAHRDDHAEERVATTPRATITRIF